MKEFIKKAKQKEGYKYAWKKDVYNIFHSTPVCTNFLNQINELKLKVILIILSQLPVIKRKKPIDS